MRDHSIKSCEKLFRVVRTVGIHLCHRMNVWHVSTLIELNGSIWACVETIFIHCDACHTGHVPHENFYNARRVIKDTCHIEMFTIRHVSQIERVWNDTCPIKTFTVIHATKMTRATSQVVQCGVSKMTRATLRIMQYKTRSKLHVSHKKLYSPTRVSTDTCHIEIYSVCHMSHYNLYSV